MDLLGRKGDGFSGSPGSGRLKDRNRAQSICGPIAAPTETPAEFRIIDAYSIAWVALGAVIGAVLGSFIDCARYRLPRGISLNKPAYSYCPSCGSRLTVLDLVPIVSWVCLGGRCRRCGAPIGIGSLVVEVCCAAIGAALAFWLVVGR